MISHLFFICFLKTLSYSSDQRARVFQNLYVWIIITAPSKDSVVSSCPMPYKTQNREAQVYWLAYEI